MLEIKIIWFFNIMYKEILIFLIFILVIKCFVVYKMQVCEYEFCYLRKNI